MVAWAAEGVAFSIILQYMNVAVLPSIAVGIYAISVLAGAVSFIPGGLGSTEAVMGLLLILIGTDPTTPVGATIVCRVATLWFAVTIGMVVVCGMEVGKWHSGRDFKDRNWK